MAPGVPNGDRMLTQLRDRHKNTFGIDSQGRIRSGLDRIDPIFSKRFHQIIKDLEPLQNRMKKRVEEHWGYAEHWAVGKSYLDQKRWVIGGAVDWNLEPTQLPVKKRVSPTHQAGKFSLAMRLRNSQLLFFIKSLMVLLGMTGLIVFGFDLFAVLGLPVLIGLYRNRYKADRTEWIVKTVHESLLDLNPELGPLCKGENTWWVESKAHSESFALAVQMLLGSIRYPRYLLVEERGGVYAVPEQLASHKNTAEAFAK